MDRSFSHKPRAQEGRLAMPHPHQFAPTTAPSPLRDPERRRAYIAREEAAHISLDEQLRQIAAAQDRDERVRRAEARDWKDQLDRWSQSTGARRQESGEIHPWSEVGEDYEEMELEPSPWEAAFEAKKVRELPHREHGGLSDGAYERLATTHGPTYGDIRSHTGRLRLGQFRELDELRQQLRDLEAQSAVFQQPPIDEPRTWSRREQRAQDRMHEQMSAARTSLARLIDSAEDVSINHKYRMIDAAYTRPGQPYRSHQTKPESPRGDGRTLRGGGWMR